MRFKIVMVGLLLVCGLQGMDEKWIPSMGFPAYHYLVDNSNPEALVLLDRKSKKLYDTLMERYKSGLRAFLAFRQQQKEIASRCAQETMHRAKPAQAGLQTKSFMIVGGSLKK